MANIRIKDLANTASSTASDDFIGVDGTTNGTRKLNAFSPSFGGNATVGGTLTVNGGSSVLTGAAYSTFYADGSSGGSFTIRKAGVAYAQLYGNETNTVVDTGGSANLILQTGGATRITMDSTRVSIPLTTASTSTSTGALVVGGGVGVAGAANVGGTLTVNGAATFNATATISSAGIADAYLKINNTFGKEVRLYSGIIGTNNNGFSVRNETNTTDWLTIDGSGNVKVPSTTASTSTSTGALVVSGGVGVAGAINAGGTVSLSTTSDKAGLTMDFPVAITGSNGPAMTFRSYTNSANLINSGRVASTITDGSASYGSKLEFAVASSGSLTTSLTLFQDLSATFAGSIKTAAPSGGTAANWKLGTVATVSPTSPNRTIEVDIGGTIYYIHAKTTNN